MVGFDKPGRKTGPGDGGYLVTDEDIPNSIVFEFILSNYNIDGNMLKDEHKKLLEEHIIPFVKANEVHLELTGTASRTGARDYNLQLSRERVERVRQYLLRRGLKDPKVPLRDMKAVGEDKSTSKSDEDELERSVRIRVVVGVRKTAVPTLPRVIVPQVTPPKKPAPTQILPEIIIEVDTRVPWAIQELSGFNAGPSVGISAGGLSAGIQAGVIEYHFLLVNRATKQMSQCRYVGQGGGLGVGPGSLKPSAGPSFGFSLTQPSHTWDMFFTPFGTTFDSFAGAAHWLEPAGLGLGSSISVQAMLKFDALNVTARVSTGHTIGTPGNFASAGNFHLKPPVQLQL